MSVLKVALLGRSLAHSISPSVHQVLFPIVQAKLDSPFKAIEYSNIECRDEEEFEAIVQKGSTQNISGFNVTFPYKYVATQLTPHISEIAKAINSVNTIRCISGLQATSTDGAGFLFSLTRSFPDFRADEYTLLILGAGGAARAVYGAITNLGWKKVIVAARSITEARRSFPDVSIAEMDAISRESGKYFVIQATPVGQRSRKSLLEQFEWHADDVAVDLVYNPRRTRFLEIASSNGAMTIDGLGMLIEQAALSQYFWMIGEESQNSLLTTDEFRSLHNSLSTLVAPRWDAFDI